MSDQISEVIEMPVLGRPFSLGLLYDCRKHKVIPGITLWDSKVLNKKVAHEHESSECNVMASNTLDDTAKALNIDGNLRLNILGGLVPVSGAAAYLHHKPFSTRQEKLTLHYKCTTRTEQMAMEQLAKNRIQHPSVLHHGIATHVVTALQYGGQAFFEFERKQSSHSNKSDLEIGVNVFRQNPWLNFAAVGFGGEKLATGIGPAAAAGIDFINIVGRPIEVRGRLKKCCEDGRNKNKDKCNFRGDFALSSVPTSFEEALEICRTIPQQLQQKSVPVTAWLYPLSHLK